MRIASIVLPGLLLASAIGSAQAGNAGQTVSVSGAANIFAAGLGSVPPGTPSCGAPNGTLPAELAIPEGATAFTVSHIAGTVYCTDKSAAVSADGSCFGGTGTNIATDTSVSGIVNANANMFLTGVMLASGEPAGPAPAAADFSNMGFASLSPLLQQSFFVGDGLTGTDSGTVQVFSIPAGAKRLFLGFADAFSFNGQEGCFSDNSGAMDVAVQFRFDAAPQAAVAAPANSPWGLLALAALLAAGAIGSRAMRQGAG